MAQQPKTKLPNRIWIGYLITVSVIALIYSLVCTPLNLIITSDALMLETVLPLALDLVMTVLNYLFYWISFAYAVYGIFAFGFSGSKYLLISYAVISALRYPLSMLVSFLLLGFPEGTTEFFSLYFGELIFYILMDMVQMGAVVLICCLIARTKGSWAEHMPALKMLDMKHPILLASLISCSVPAVLSLLFRVYYDISTGFNTSELPLMALYYLSDLLSVLVGYFTVLFFLNRFYLREYREQNREVLR